MKLERLGNVIKIISGSPFDSKFFNENKDGMPLIRVRDVNSGFAGIYYSGKYEDTFIINDGDLLIGLDGDFKCVEWKYGKALLNQRVCKLIPNEALVSRDYILHFLPQALNEIHRNTNFTTVKHLSTKTINEIKIPLPTLSDQIRIAQILSQAESLIAQRKQSISLLDELLKSTFLEMFGDPFINPKKLKVVTLSDIAAQEKNAIVDGPFGSSLKNEDYFETGIPIIRINNIRDEGFYSNEFKYISEQKYNELIRSKVKHNDILIARVGNTIGKTCLFNQRFKALLSTTGVAKLTVNNEMVNIKFVMAHMRLPQYRKYIWDQTEGGGQPYLNLKKIKNFMLILPSIDKQNQYAEIFEKIETLKTQYQQSLAELQNMYGVLSQKAFKGELSLEVQSKKFKAKSSKPKVKEPYLEEELRVDSYREVAEAAVKYKKKTNK